MAPSIDLLRKRCFLLELPAELRIKIYNFVFDDKDLEKDHAGKADVEQQDRSSHLHCHRILNEDGATLLLESTGLLEKYQLFGLPIRKPIALLETCRNILHEGTVELYKRVEMRTKIYQCGYRTKHGALGCVSTYKTFRGQALQQLLEKSALNVEIKEERLSNDPDAVNPYGRFPVLLKFLFTRMRHVNVTILLKNLWFIAINLRRLNHIANALQENSSVQSVQFSFRVKGVGEQSIRCWKAAAFQALARLPPNRARMLLWIAIVKSEVVVLK